MWLRYQSKRITFSSVIITIILVLFCNLTDSRQCKLIRLPDSRIHDQGSSPSFRHSLDHHVVLGEIVSAEDQSFTSLVGRSCSLLHDSSLLPDSRLYLLPTHQRLYLAVAQYSNPKTIEKLATLVHKTQLRCGRFYYCNINVIKEYQADNGHMLAKRSIHALMGDDDHPYGLFNSYWTIIATSIMVMIVTIVVGFLCARNTSKSQDSQLSPSDKDVEKTTASDTSRKQPESSNDKTTKSTVTSDSIPPQVSKPSSSSQSRPKLKSKSNAPVLESDRATATAAVDSPPAMTSNQKEANNSDKSSVLKETDILDDDYPTQSPASNSDQETTISVSTQDKTNSIESPYANVSSTMSSKDSVEKTTEASENANSSDEKLSSDSNVKNSIMITAPRVYEELQFKDATPSENTSTVTNPVAKPNRSAPITGEQPVNNSSIANRKLPDIPRIKNPDVIYAQIIKTRPISIDCSTTSVSKLMEESSTYRGRVGRSKTLNPRSVSSPYPPRSPWAEDDLALSQSIQSKTLENKLAPGASPFTDNPENSATTATAKKISYSLKDIDSSGYAIIKKKISSLVTMPANITNDDLENNVVKVEDIETFGMGIKEEEPYEDVDKLRSIKQIEVIQDKSNDDIASN
ncbi:hypothetical protein TrispH2_008552 [Trichoplax sp. H2]|nr:hypothetical protein TrispH2_008552 [Trichoplax sp. H2]|eukprot:RDD38383.1 hypothetical protein TrispH2_008552 [Trichoplax sp. H2]